MAEARRPKKQRHTSRNRQAPSSWGPKLCRPGGYSPPENDVVCGYLRSPRARSSNRNLDRNPGEIPRAAASRFGRQSLPEPACGNPLAGRSGAMVLDAAVSRSIRHFSFAIERPQLVLGLFQFLFPVPGKTFAAAIDEEREHRHCRTVGRRFPSPAAISRSLERNSNLVRVGLCKDPLLKREGVAFPGHASGPTFSATLRPL